MIFSIIILLGVLYPELRIGRLINMFCVNDVVLYSCYGVCEIMDITIKNFGGSKEEYYVLRPLL